MPEEVKLLNGSIIRTKTQEPQPDEPGTLTITVDPEKNKDDESLTREYRALVVVTSNNNGFFVRKPINVFRLNKKIVKIGNIHTFQDEDPQARQNDQAKQADQAEPSNNSLRNR